MFDDISYVFEIYVIKKTIEQVEMTAVLIFYTRFKIVIYFFATVIWVLCKLIMVTIKTMNIN